MISSMILRMIWPYDISNLVYHSHMISWILWYSILYHSTCGAAGWGGLGAPDARRSSGSGHAIANVLGAGVQLYGDCLDSAHGLVAVDAARVVSRSRLVVIEKSRLAAAGCAAHAGKAPMHRANGSTWLGWHLGLKYGLGVQDGFKLETGCQWVKEDSEAGEYLYSHQYLKTWTPSP
jgi:hypothetical protein